MKSIGMMGHVSLFDLVVALTLVEIILRDRRPQQNKLLLA